jgi:UDP-N-acetylmuramate dehydrogenase
MQLQRDIPLAPFTTLGLGGKAEHVAVVDREAEVPGAVAFADDLGGSLAVLGGGSNVVVADEGVSGLVLRIASRGVQVDPRGDAVRLTVAAGEPWDLLVERAVDEGWSGLEALSGIPGLVGGAPVQNIGAYGQEAKDIVAVVRAYDRVTRAFVDLPRAECRFGYRTSLFKGTGRHIVTSVTFELPCGREGAAIAYPELARALGVAEGEKVPARRVRDTVVALRRSKGMLLDPSDPESVSVGSFFTNPVVDAAGLERVAQGALSLGLVADGSRVPRFPAGEGAWKVPAAWLIERAGFARGFAAGRVHVSKRHALALVHDGGGSTRELVALARRIAGEVQERFGVRLTPEAVFLGCAW